MICKRALELCMLPYIFFYSSWACAQPNESGFMKRTATIGANTYCYQIFVPHDYTPKKKWPVILFLHGAGERGDDCVTQTVVGLGPAIKREATSFPAIVVFPQCRRGEVWFGDMEAQALDALEQTVKEFNGDRQRIYLTGLSMGGYGAWYLAVRHPGKFAAMAPICGGVVPPARFPFPPEAAAQIPAEKPYETIAAQIGKTPVWIFHGEADVVIPVTESRRMAAALEALGGNMKYTEYPGVGHNSWDKAYAEPELLKWLLAHTNK